MHAYIERVLDRAPEVDRYEQPTPDSIRTYEEVMTVEPRLALPEQTLGARSNRG
jgi:hypothetical protein